MNYLALPNTITRLWVVQVYNSNSSLIQLGLASLDEMDAC